MLVSRTHTATEACAGCWLPVQVLVEEWGMKQGAFQAAGGREWECLWGKKKKKKKVQSAEGSWQLCWLSVSLVVKAAGVLCRAGHWEPWALQCPRLILGSSCSSSLFLAISIYLALLASGWGKTEEDPSCDAPEGWGSWLLTPLSPSQGAELYLVSELPLGAEPRWFRGMG